MANWQTLDPEAVREAERYENPIPSRELILLHLDQRGSPATREQLLVEFGLAEDEQIEALRRRLRAMERDGQLIYTRRGAYAPTEKLDLISGRVSGHRDGFGFLLPDDGGEDLFLSPAQMRTVFDGDRVLARVSGYDRRGRREGAIVEVIERAHETLVGRYFEESGIGFVQVDNPKIHQDVLIVPERTLGAKIGQFVEVEISQWPTARFQPRGNIIEVIGDYMAPGMEIDVALRSFGIPHVWPEAVLKEVDRLQPSVDERDKRNRIDLRHLPFVTIDGEDARDFDDAVYCEAQSGWKGAAATGWRLYVAIADVSHYVKVGSALDAEAESRGNSVYFPDRVIPMLPEVLSNGLCSLNPRVDRLVMVCEMLISTTGQLLDYRFCEAVINSHARLTYNKVSAMLEQPGSQEGMALRAEYQRIVPSLETLHALYRTLLTARHERGAVDFETQETRIVFGEDRKIENIEPTRRNDAHRLIEECMLAANVATADFLQKHDIPALYRVHDGPPQDRLETLRTFLGELGLPLQRGKSRDKPSPKDYQRLLDGIRNRPDFHLIQTVMLRSLSQAVYSADNQGHFGLNYPAYTHFTSPIRRYPDLLVHRAIRSVIRSRRKTAHVLRAAASSLAKASIYPYDEAVLERLGVQCSMTERRADEATRDVVNWLKCEFMQKRVGERFEGVITAVTGFGIFVELRDIYVEGLVHVTALPADYYHFDSAHYRLTGERSGRTFRLGDGVRVTVARVDLDERKIDFELVQTACSNGNGAPASGNTDVGKSRALKKQLLTEANGKKGAGQKTAKKSSAGKGKAVPGGKNGKTTSRGGNGRKGKSGS